MEDTTEMSSQAQEFCLKWNNFQASLVTAIDGFKNDLEFVDVTIACEGHLLKAHKMLLSACSIFFRDIFKDVTQYQHPVIVLPGDVKFNDLEKILTFIYQGEVNVHQENLPRFLKTAEMLKIRGLAEDNEKRALKTAISPKSSGNNSNPSQKRRKLSGGQSTSANDTFKQAVDDKSKQFLGDAESDSEMVPVKQEMIELKEIDFDSTDAESFIADALLKEVAPAHSSSSSQPGHSTAPPPPGPLLPSYIPPTQHKNTDDSEIELVDDVQACRYGRIYQDRPHSKGQHPFENITQYHPEEPPEYSPYYTALGSNPVELFVQGFKHQLVRQQTKRWRCKRCHGRGHEKRTKLKCNGCGVALCVLCFHQYHYELQSPEMCE